MDVVDGYISVFFHRGRGDRRASSSNVPNSATTRHLPVLSKVCVQLLKINVFEVYSVLAPKCRVVVSGSEDERCDVIDVLLFYLSLCVCCDVKDADGENLKIDD